MGVIKSFPVFVDMAEVHVSSKMSAGASSVVISDVPPGGGPPPHTHSREDETFLALSGEFEVLVDDAWVGLEIGVPVFSARGNKHTFRNKGTTMGRLHVTAAPGGLDEFLEELSPLSQGKPDIPAIMELGKRYGITLHPPPGAPHA